MSEVIPTTGSPNPTESYFDIPVASLQPDTTLNFDLFNCQSFGKYILIHPAEIYFTEEIFLALENTKVDVVFIPTTQRDKYENYVEDHLDHIISSNQVPENKKATILYHSASKVMQNLFVNPTSLVNIKRTIKTVENTVTHILNSHSCLANMMQIMAYDYNTYSHSMNVCIFGVALGKKHGLGKSELHTLGNGLLMHDIGKSQVDNSILMKQSSLTNAEWEIVKTHPTLGVDLLRQTQQIEEEVLTVVLQHHEKCSGKGYPGGLKEPGIHLYSKIASLADVFDALTTKRPYKNACESFPAFKIMLNEMKDSFDLELLREMILLMTSEVQIQTDDELGNQQNRSAA